ncbi:MAG: ABC transporter ATP-binding protein [Candidatus Omnitrophica bacterium]|nr:ABC transporter ATP-binding protein [Candidatus Omnitrophota bacterium]
MNNGKILEIRGLRKDYKSANKTVSVLKGIDLKIDRGRFIAITGPSGAGKSTLLHISGGLDLPSAGQVFFEGEDIYTLAESKICRLRNSRIAFVFQFYHLLSEFTVLENVLMPAFIGGHGLFSGHKLREEACAALKDLGLEDRMSHFPSQLSGGEMQRTALARALLNKPSLLLCDEPTGNLDSKIGNEIIALIKKISRDSQMTVVMVTHNLELARQADEIYRLNDGVLIN